MCTTFVRLPNRLTTDQGAALISDRRKKLTDLNGMEVMVSGVQANSSLKIDERLYEPIRGIHRKIRHEYPSVSPRIVFKVSVKAWNGTTGESEFVLTHLVFSVIPAFIIISTEIPNQKRKF